MTVRDIHSAIGILSLSDYRRMTKILGVPGRIFMPDKVLAPAGNPYLFRWYIMYDEAIGGLMLHLQVADDPERPLHDHPWDNTSLILAGGYRERIQSFPPNGEVEPFERKPGDLIERAAHEAHRLSLPEGVSYTITLFMCGPKVKDWGFWYGDEWHHHKHHVRVRDGISVHVNREEAL